MPKYPPDLSRHMPTRFARRPFGRARIGLFAKLKLHPSISLICQKCASSRFVSHELQGNFAAKDAEVDVSGLVRRKPNPRYGAVLIFSLGFALGSRLQVPSIHFDHAPRMFMRHIQIYLFGDVY